MSSAYLLLRLYLAQLVDNLIEPQPIPDWSLLPLSNQPINCRIVSAEVGENLSIKG